MTGGGLGLGHGVASHRENDFKLDFFAFHVYALHRPTPNFVEGIPPFHMGPVGASWFELLSKEASLLWEEPLTLHFTTMGTQTPREITSDN